MQNSLTKALIHTSILTISVGIAYILSFITTFQTTRLQVISFIILVFALTQLVSKKVSFIKGNKLAVDFLLLTLVVYISVFSTGSLFSPIFFLVYFLLFGISLLFEPSASFLLAVISSIFFLLTPKKEFLPEILQLLSLFLISPLALIFGTQYVNLLQSIDKIQILKKEESILTDEVVKQEHEVKRWTTQELNERLGKIWRNLSTLLEDRTLEKNQKTKLVEISNQLKNLLKSAEILEKKIEK